jgi:dodecin
MSVAKIIEVTASSKTSFEDAMKKGVARASKTIKGIRGAWVQDQKVDVENGKITAFRVTMKITFVLE